MDLRAVYTAIMELEKLLQADLMREAEIQLNFRPQHRGDPDYRTVQALAAAYTLEDYLSNVIAAGVKPDPAALTLEELKDIGHGAHIWVKIKTEKPMFDREEPFATMYTAAAVTDELDEMGIVALWSADPLNPMLVEKDYGVSWWAYQSDPREDDE